MTNSPTDRAPADASFAAPARLYLDGAGLAGNWRALDGLSGAASAGAAVKADGYGLGARAVVRRLADAGCRDFFVANWAEAAGIADLVPPDRIAVLNGVFADDIAPARALGAVPVLNSMEQVAAWRAGGGGRCHIMLDSGMNRLGLDLRRDRPDWAGLDIDMVMSHLASADEDGPQNEAQRARFDGESRGVPGQRRSLANSAGIMLGPRWHYDVTRPGLAIYGGVPVTALAAAIRPVVQLAARIVQVRMLDPGDSVGYNALFTATQPMRAAIAALGYADGYARAFTGHGRARADGAVLPLLGRVSMDLVVIGIDAAPSLSEGDWLALDYDLPRAAAATGLSQYELLTGLSDRYERIWD